MRGDDGTHAEHTGEFEDDVAERADDDDEPDVVTQQPLTQDEGVLRSDGDDEAEAGEEAGEQVRHGSDVRGVRG